MLLVWIRERYLMGRGAWGVTVGLLALLAMLLAGYGQGQRPVGALALPADATLSRHTVVATLPGETATAEPATWPVETAEPTETAGAWPTETAEAWPTETVEPTRTAWPPRPTTTPAATFGADTPTPTKGDGPPTPTSTPSANIVLSEDTVPCKGEGCGGHCWFQNRIALTCDNDKKIVGFSLTFPKGSTDPTCCTADRANGRGRFLAQADNGTWYGWGGAAENPGTKDKPKPLGDIFDTTRPTQQITLKSGNKLTELDIEISADLTCKCDKDGTVTRGAMRVRIQIKDCAVTISRPQQK